MKLKFRERVIVDGKVYTANTKFKVGKKRHRVGRDGLMTLKLLSEIVRQSRLASQPKWLIPVRPHVFEAIARGRYFILNHVIENAADNSQTLRYAIWLRGQFGRTKGTKYLYSLFLRVNNYVIRKEIMRALRRMHGWAELRKIAAMKALIDPRLARMAHSRPRLEYEERLVAFLDNATPREVSGRRVSFFVDDYDIEEGQPKPESLIREMLTRIQSMLYQPASE